MGFNGMGMMFVSRVGSEALPYESNPYLQGAQMIFDIHSMYVSQMNNPSLGFGLFAK